MAKRKWQKFLWHYEIKFLDPSPGAKLCLFYFFTSAFERAFYLVIISRYPCNFLYFVSSWLNRTTVKYNLNCIAQQLLWTWLIVVVADMRTKESNLLQQKVFKKIQIDTGTLKCGISEEHSQSSQLQSIFWWKKGEKELFLAI